MKWYRLIGMVLTAFVTISNAKAQLSNVFPKSAYIESYKLEVTHNKTTNLIFPAAITSVDRGSQDILVQKTTGVENILKVKADVKDFVETSLSIITADGKLYSFIVAYVNQPAYLNINVTEPFTANSAFSKPIIKKENASYSNSVINTAAIAKYSDSVINKESNIHSIYAENSKISFELNAFYIHEDVLFCKLSFKNNSNINYDIDQFRFYICDKKQSKRTAIQEIEIIPLYITGDTARIMGKIKQIWVVALPKFTIPDSKYFAIEIMEKNGGRHLNLKIKNRYIMKAGNM